MNKEHGAQRPDYIELLEDLLAKINHLDHNTYSTFHEPEWWLDMMSLERQCRESIIKMEDLA